MRPRDPQQTAALDLSLLLRRYRWFRGVDLGPDCLAVLSSSRAPEEGAYLPARVGEFEVLHERDSASDRLSPEEISSAEVALARFLRRYSWFRNAATTTMAPSRLCVTWQGHEEFDPKIWIPSQVDSYRVDRRQEGEARS